MKAVLFRGAGLLELTDVPLPKIGDGELLVRVGSAAICGTDIRILKNGLEGAGETNPRILGHEFSGVIEEAGKEVPYFKPGMRVIVAPNFGCGVCRHCISGNTHLCRDYQAIGIQIDGAFAEYVRIPETAVRQGNVMEIGSHLSYRAAALCEPLSCVCNGLEKARVGILDQVLIMGAGAIGMMHGKLSRFYGAVHVMLYDPSGERISLCNQVDPGFETFSGDLGELKDWVMERSNHTGIDVCVTACAASSAQQTALELMAVGGRVCFFGGLPKDQEQVILNTNLIHYRELCVAGSTRASLRQFSNMKDLVSSGAIKVEELVTKEYAIEDYKEAFLAAETGKGIKTAFVFDTK